MAEGGTGIAVGCTTCGVELFLDVEDEDALRARLAGFFGAHEGCDVFMDVSRTRAPLPRRPQPWSGA